MPLLVHPVRGPLGVHGLAVEHARLADREVGDVDHLLHFTVALGLDLAVFQRDQRAQRILVFAQQFAEAAHRIAAARRRHVAPRERGPARAGDDRIDVGGIGQANAAERPLAGWIGGYQRRTAAAPLVGAEAGAGVVGGDVESCKQRRGAWIHAVHLWLGVGRARGLNQRRRAGIVARKRPRAKRRRAVGARLRTARVSVRPDRCRCARPLALPAAPAWS